MTLTAGCVSRCASTPGLTHVNDAVVNDDTLTAFAGPGGPGTGRSGGRAIEQFTTTQRVSVHRPPRDFPPG